MSSGRRQFFAQGGAAALLCTLGGHKVRLDTPADVEALAAELKVPPKVAAHDARQARQFPLPGASSGGEGSGVRREYWIKAEKVRWDIVPTGRDEMMNEKVKGKASFKAFAYRRYTENFGQPMGPAMIPGPLIEGEIGDTIVVNFQNTLRPPVTMHPHGVFYANEMDGAYKGKFTDPGGFVQHRRTFQYVWDCKPGTAGNWLYHDHGPMDPIPLYKGLFGPLMIREKGEAPPDAEFFLTLHSFPPVATGLRSNFSCINGRSYAGNTPTLHAKVGERVRLPRDRPRQRLPHVPCAWAPLGRPRRGQGDRHQGHGPGGVDLGGVHRGQSRPLVLPLPRLQPPAHGDERVVHRQLGLGLLVALTVAVPAGAASRKVAIGNYQWSTPTVNVDLGEHVTWYWVGPDTMHSVTGTSVNDQGQDSDPNVSQPQHQLGDTFSLSFNTPGTYTFQCKLHSGVRGTIVVSGTPGDPKSDPDPDPPLQVDLTAPYLTGLRLADRRLGRTGTRLRFALDSPGTLDAELWRVGRHGKRRYAGYQTWRGYVGYNAVRFATRGKGLRLRKRLRPGRYVAHVTARDDAENVGRAAKLHFRVKG